MAGSISCYEPRHFLYTQLPDRRRIFNAHHWQAHESTLHTNHPHARGNHCRRCAHYDAGLTCPAALHSGYFEIGMDIWLHTKSHKAIASEKRKEHRDQIVESGAKKIRKIQI